MPEKKNIGSDNCLKKFFSSIKWGKTIRMLLFVFISAVIIISVGLTLCNINKNVYRDDEKVAGKVLIDVSVSDTLTRGMDDKLNRVLQDLLQIKQDSVAVEVRKIHSK